MSKIYYARIDQTITDEKFDRIFEINGKNCKNSQSLFTEFATKLEFPDYFGRNWDAFDECIGDLSWLNAKTLLIKVKNVGSILSLETKRDDGKDWSDVFYGAFFEEIKFGIKHPERKKEFDEPFTSFFFIIESGNFKMLEKTSKEYPEVEVVNLDLKK